MMVIDASAVVELLLGGRRAEPVIPWFEDHEGRLHAPGLLDVEVAQALRRLARSGFMAAGRARAAVELLQELPVDRHLETPLLPRMWELRGNPTAYDAGYVALAEALGCALLTFDVALAGAPELPVEVELPG